MIPRTSAYAYCSIPTYIEKFDFTELPFLPSANEVWGQGNIFRSVRQSFCPRGLGCVWQREEGGMRAGQTVTEAGGTHPAGMHSCAAKLLAVDYLILCIQNTPAVIRFSTTHQLCNSCTAGVF